MKTITIGTGLRYFGIWLLSAFFLFAGANIGTAADFGTLGTVDAIDGTFASGGGSFSGSLSSGADDDWLVFGGVAGDNIAITYSANGYSLHGIVLFETENGVVELGDVANITNFNFGHLGDGTDFSMQTNFPTNFFSTPVVLNLTLANTGEYAIALKAINDNFISSNIWTVQLTGNTGTAGAIPEPAALTLLGMGLVGLGAARRRRKKRAA
jgi:hypothetical protein